MKKKILSIILLLVLIIPFRINAVEYTSQTLEEACESEEIDFVHPNYKDASDKINVYLFRGEGCQHCHDFLEYLESIVEESGKYFNVVSYEVWEDPNNSTLMDKALEFMGDDADSGVPYIVIGNKSWVGYADSIKDDILNAITTAYNAETKFDIMEQINVKTKTTSSTEETDGLIIVILILLVVFDGFLLYKTINDKKQFEERIYKLENKLSVINRKNNKNK